MTELILRLAQAVAGGGCGGEPPADRKGGGGVEVDRAWLLEAIVEVPLLKTKDKRVAGTPCLESGGRAGANQHNLNRREWTLVRRVGERGRGGRVQRTGVRSWRQNNGSSQ